MEKLFNFRSPHLLCLRMIFCFVGVTFSFFSFIYILSVFMVFCVDSLRVSDLLLRSLVNLNWCLWSKRNVELVSHFYVFYISSTICWRGSFLHHVLLTPLSKFKWLYRCMGFFVVFCAILFDVRFCCQCCAVFVTISPKYDLRNGRLIWLIGLLELPYEFYNCLFLVLWRTLLGILSKLW